MIISKIESFFKIKQHNSSIKTEIIAGITTFLAMSYIVFVNPTILGNAGMNTGAVFVATALAAAFSCFIMGLYANWPLALAPGMGTNAWFTYGVVLGMGHTWQVALGATFISGVLMVILTLLPVRKAIIDSIPNSLKMGLAASVGMFIVFIGLKSAGIVVANKGTLVGLGDLTQPSAYLTILGLLVIIICDALKVKGSIIISILFISIISVSMGLTNFAGILDLPPSIAPTFLEMDIKGAFSVGIVTIIISIFLIDFFNSTAVFVGIMGAVGDKLEDKNIKKALLSDGIGTSIGAILGVNTVTTYSENVSGVVKAGGRTGLVTIVVGILFLLTLFFSPLLKMIPSFAAAPAMIYISALMFGNIKSIDWSDISEVLPAFLLLVITLLTYSIFNGIGIASIVWFVMKIAHKKLEKKNWPIILIALSFVVYIAL